MGRAGTVLQKTGLLEKPLRGGQPQAYKAQAPAGGSMQVVFVSAEVAPWSITGGLGAVCDGLPRAMAKAGHRVMSIAPRYDQYFDAWDTEYQAEVPLGEATTTVRFFHCFKKGVDRVFVDHPLFLEKVWGMSKQKLYGPKWGQDYEDNQLRFAMFCHAALDATKNLKLGGSSYGEDVVFVANDWHAALVPMYVRNGKYKGEWKNTKTVALCHNIVFQGRFPSDAGAGKRLRLSDEMLGSMSMTSTISKNGATSGQQKVLNFLLGAIKHSDLTLTVSPRYAHEVKVEGAGPHSGKGAGLEKALQSKGVRGILNGVEDIVRPSNRELGLGDNSYDKNSLEKKRVLKTIIQKATGLNVDPNIPLFVFLGRLDGQKGVDIMFEAISRMLSSGARAQFITMGSGTEKWEEIAADLDDRFPGQFKAVLSFKGQEKYRTYAAADFAMMPSRYEPCGLVQMEAMRFGTIPIVTPTGGLTDTVQDGRTGLVMEHECNSEALTDDDVSMMVNNLNRACALAADPMRYRGMQVQAMEASESFTWAAAVKQYEEEFKRMGAYMHK